MFHFIFISSLIFIILITIFFFLISIIFKIDFLLSILYFNIKLIENWTSYLFLVWWSRSHDLGHGYEMLTRIDISLFLLSFLHWFFLFYHLILNFLKIRLCDFFIFLFMRLFYSHKLGWVPSGFAQFSSILFFGYFLKLNIFPAPPFYIFFKIGLHNSYYLLSIRFSRSYDLTCKVKRLYLSLLVCYFFRVFFVDLLLLLYIWTDGNWTSLFFFSMR